MSHDTIKRKKSFGRKAYFLFQKWQEIGKFSLEHLKVSKFVFSWDPFVQSRTCMSYKRTEEL